VVVPVAAGQVAGPLEGGRQPVRLGQAGDGDLQVDDVLGGQAGHGGGADVVDAAGGLAEVVAQLRRQPLELVGPGRVVVHDHDGGHAGSVGPRARPVGQASGKVQRFLLRTRETPAAAS
jgi:hypothetical protein